jgi:hypothetical protein
MRKKADAKASAHSHRNPLWGKWNINRFAFACGEADVQPSSLPEHSSTVFFPCQGYFIEKIVFYTRQKRIKLS